MNHRKFKRQSVRPFSQDTPRPPPGESLRLKLEELEFEALICFLVLLGAAVSGLLTLLARTSGSTASVDIIGLSINLGILIAVVIAAFISGAKLRGIIRQVRSIRLGFDGERHVGQILNRLMLRGFIVYHDIVFERAGKTFNIDHIVVGKGGVYAVETKTRRKPLDKKGEKQWKVRYDGKKLQFPHYTESKAIQQTQANAQFLSKWLSDSLGEHVPVGSLIVIPGWWVESTTYRPVAVLNDQAVDKFRFGIGAPLDAARIKQVDTLLFRHNSESLN